ncbi:TetR family transcriptional regulator [Nocardioides sp.]|uniref:TetR family transcriptional regulator n=1 Tax=Nocardioides sp. TaxID=35761 RepID=UPI001A27D1E9|nr:TetR family transcriptional regulator [Nocardioides sp.]MBJ7358888.1 TetR family transcriptional regulator [Nocardioides sp.]
MPASTSPSAVPLRERQRTALRADIERAAIGLFAEHGFDQVTTEAIAEAVGISPSTFFRHVPNKDQLLLAATERGRAQIVASLRDSSPDDEVAASLAAAILTRTAQFVDDVEGVEVWRRAMASAPPALRRASLLSVEDCDELIAAVAARLGPSSPDLAAGVLVRSMVAAAEYAYEWWLTHDRSEPLHVLTERALDQVSRGVDRGVAP